MCWPVGEENFQGWLERRLGDVIIGKHVQGDIDLLERYLFSVQFLVRIIRI